MGKMLKIGELKKFSPKKDDAKVEFYYKGYCNELPVIVFPKKGSDGSTLIINMDIEKVQWIADGKKKSEGSGKA